MFTGWDSAARLLPGRGTTSKAQQEPRFVKAARKGTHELTSMRTCQTPHPRVIHARPRGSTFLSVGCPVGPFTRIGTTREYVSLADTRPADPFPADAHIDLALGPVAYGVLGNEHLMFDRPGVSIPAASTGASTGVGIDRGQTDLLLFTAIGTRESRLMRVRGQT